MLVLDAGKHRELATGSQVHFEQTDAVDDMIVDAFGVAPGLIQAGLPVAFQNVARITAIGNPLRSARPREHKCEREDGAGQRNSPERRKAHMAPFRQRPSARPQDTMQNSGPVTNAPKKAPLANGFADAMRKRSAFDR